MCCENKGTCCETKRRRWPLPHGSQFKKTAVGERLIGAKFYRSVTAQDFTQTTKQRESSSETPGCFDSLHRRAIDAHCQGRYRGTVRNAQGAGLFFKCNNPWRVLHVRLPPSGKRGKQITISAARSRSQGCIRESAYHRFRVVVFFCLPFKRTAFVWQSVRTTA